MVEQEQEMKEFYQIYSLDNLSLLDNDMVAKLVSAGITDIEVLTNSSVETVSEVLGISQDDAINLINAAIDYLAEKLEE